MTPLRAGMAWGLALLLMVAGGAWAQEAAALDEARPALSQYRIDQWQTDQGLPMDTVQTVLQSRDGSLWVGTGGGLAQFDGLRFRTLEASTQPELARRSIFGLFEDRDGRVWIGHSGGASLAHQGRFDTAIDSAAAGGRRVWGFVQDRNGDVWAAGEAGLLRWSAGRVTRWSPEDGLPVERLRALALDREGRIWLGGSRGGLVARTPDGRYQVWSAPEGFPESEIRQILADPQGGVWVATAGAGLVHVDAHGNLARWGLAQGLPSEHLTSLALDATGALWMGHWGDGVSRLAGGRVTRLAASRALAGNQIWALHADREGSLWVGSWNGGLNRLRPRVFAVVGEPEGLGADNTRAVLHARDGSTWVATAGGGVSHLVGNRIRVLRERDGLAADESSTLWEDPDGAVWIGSYTGGLTRWRGGQVRRFGLADGLPHTDVRAVLRDPAGRLWVGTKLGLARFDEATQRFAAVPGLPDESVTVLLAGRDGSLWAGTSGQGLLQLRDGTLLQRVGREQGLVSNWILSLHEDAQGRLWIGSNGEGLTRRLPSGALGTVRPEHGLWDGVMLTLLPDRHGNLWVSTNRGFYRVALRDLEAFLTGRQPRVHSVAYGPGDGLRSTTFAGGLQPAGAVDAKGRVWLPSLRGVVIVDPARLPDAGEPPQARLHEVSIGGQWQPAHDAVQLPVGSAPLVLRWAANTVLNADRVRFRFQMQGLSDSWIETGKEREARFPALPPGDYLFRVASSLDGQAWRSSDPVPVQVPPLLHQSTAFRVALAVFLIGAVVAVYRWRTRQLRDREVALQRLVDERTDALQRANAHLEALSFRDALTGLANRRRFDEQLATEWRRCARQRLPLALLVVDIDHFKAYNDTLGHTAGDACLKEVAALLQRHGARAGELVARYGGEEFVLLLPGVGLADARVHAERLRQACEAEALPHPASPVGPWLTLSVGVAVSLPGDEAQPDGLFAAADAALYRAKAAGRNRVG